MKSVSRWKLFLLCVSLPIIAAPQLAHADDPPDVTEVTIVSPVANTPPANLPTQIGYALIKFNSTNHVRKSGFNPNQAVVFQGEFTISCEGSIDYDGTSYTTGQFLTIASATGRVEKSYSCTGTQQVKKGDWHTATANATFTLNSFTLTASAPSVTFKPYTILTPPTD